MGKMGGRKEKKLSKMILNFKAFKIKCMIGTFTELGNPKEDQG